MPEPERASAAGERLPGDGLEVVTASQVPTPLAGMGPVADRGEIEPRGSQRHRPLLAASEPVASPDTDEQSDVPRDETLVWNESASGVRSMTGFYPPSEGTHQGPSGDSNESIPTLPPNQLSFQLPGLQVQALIGKSLCLVYKAYQPALKRHVALKVLPPAFADDPIRMKRFYREAETASRFFGSSILPVYDLLEYQNQPIIMMPYVDGGTLEQVIADRLARQREDVDLNDHPWASLDLGDYLERVLLVLDRVVESVATLHDHKTIHRDIKPANLLLDLKGMVWLADFGLAKLQEDCPLTRHGQGVGTVGYMAPEQYEGGTGVGPASDVFGLAATIYRVLTLGFPYGQIRVTYKAPTPLPPSKRQPALGPDFDYLLLKALETDPAERFANAREFSDEWKAARNQKGKQLRMRHTVGRWLRRYARAAVVGGAVAVFVSIATLVPFITPRPVDNPSGLMGVSTVPVVMQSSPAKASLAMVLLDPNTHDFPIDPTTQGLDKRLVRHATTQADGTIRLQLSPGLYFVECGVPGIGFQQCYRYVPSPNENVQVAHFPGTWTRAADGTIVLDAFKVQPDSRLRQRPMATIEGDNQFLPNWGKDLVNALRPRKGMPSFLLDCHEVTFGEYKRVMGRSPVRLSASVDPHDLMPAASVTFVEAMEYAERAGLRLPQEGEMRYLFNGTFRPILPTSFNLWAAYTLALVDQSQDQYPSEPPVTGLRTSLGEWTQTPMPGNNFGLAKSTNFLDRRMVVGTTPTLVAKGNQSPNSVFKKYEPLALPFFETGPGMGFRCARSSNPLLLNPDEGPWAETEVAADRPLISR